MPPAGDAAGRTPWYAHYLEQWLTQHLIRAQILLCAIPDSSILFAKKTQSLVIFFTKVRNAREHTNEAAEIHTFHRPVADQYW